MRYIPTSVQLLFSNSHNDGTSLPSLLPCVLCILFTPFSPNKYARRRFHLSTNVCRKVSVSLCLCPNDVERSSSSRGRSGRQRALHQSQFWTGKRNGEYNEGAVTGSSLLTVGSRYSGRRLTVKRSSLDRTSDGEFVSTPEISLCPGSMPCPEKPSPTDCQCTIPCLTN